MVFGYEVIGIVMDVGLEVMKFKFGDIVGVGCMVMLCCNCDFCEKGLEQFCDKVVWIYNFEFFDGIII